MSKKKFPERVALDGHAEVLLMTIYVGEAEPHGHPVYPLSI